MPIVSTRSVSRRRACAAGGRIDFAVINEAALVQLPELLACWLPGGRREGREYVALNPRRRDRSMGSFKINLDTGRWADFAVGERGGDVVALVGYLFGLPPHQAAQELAARVRLGRAGARP